jgi:hypothetical protein
VKKSNSGTNYPEKENIGNLKHGELAELSFYHSMSATKDQEFTYGSVKQKIKESGSCSAQPIILSKTTTTPYTATPMQTGQPKDRVRRQTRIVQNPPKTVASQELIPG